MRRQKKAALMAAAIGGGMFLVPSIAGACYYHWSHGLPEPTGIWPVIPQYVPNARILNAQDAITNLQAQDAMDDAAVNTSAGINTSSGSWEMGSAIIAAPLEQSSTSSVIYGGSSVMSATNGASPIASTASSPSVTTISDPSITGWQQNSTVYGNSTNSSINSIVSSVLANVQTVAYTSSYVYVKATGIPSYALGPSYGTDPNIPHNQNKTYEINRNPTQASSGTVNATGLGPIGIAVNGVSIYNPWDANYYKPGGGTTTTSGIWQQNADVVEAPTFDSGPGHANQSYDYHYHEAPTALINQLDPGNTGQHASPLVGYAADGYPIFGPWGYVVNSQGYAVSGPNGQPEIELMTSSYSFNTYTNNIRTDPAAPNNSADDGPNVSSSYPLGYYLQDYYYNAGSGVLNQYNMRYGVAPGFSTPVWAYYLSDSESINAGTGTVTLTPTYPYIVGPDYFGTPDSNDMVGKTVTVPGAVSYYVQGVTADTGSWNVDSAGNWSTVGDWSGAVADGTDSVANFAAVISAARTVTVDSAQTVGTINFSSPYTYTIAGINRLSMNVSTGQVSINVSAGSPVISAPLALLAATSIMVNPAGSTLTLSNLQSSNIALTIGGAGSVAVNSLRLASLNITSGTVSVISNGTSTGTSVLSGLNIASGSVLNLNNNALIVHAGNLAAITQWVDSGFNNGAWNGSGITSAVANGDMALGILLNNNGGALGALYSNFEGQPTSLNDVLIKYTYFGDATLDGKVDGSDYSRIDSAVLTGATGWSNGDFNYDGVINGSDYTLIDNAFNTQGAQLSTQVDPTASIAAQISGDADSVPEPAIGGMTGAMLLGLLGRGRRRY